MRSRWIVAVALLAAACGDGDGVPPPDGEPVRRPDLPVVVDADADGVPATGDCDDHDPQLWSTVRAYLDEDLDGHGAGALQPACGGHALRPGWSSDDVDCDDRDAARWRALPLHADDDQDGVGAGPPQTLCTSGGAPPGWAADGGDCAPDDATRWRQLRFAFRDADGDLATAPSAGEVCAGAELPPGHHLAPLRDDCDDSDPSRYDLKLGYLDADRDGVGDGRLGTYCVGASGVASEAGDCAPDDPVRWRLHPHAGRDADGDGYTSGGSGTVCAGASLPPPYLSSAKGYDCDDGDGGRWQRSAGYVDGDGDGVGAEASVVCAGWSLPSGYARSGGDCAPDDPTRWRSYAYAYRDADGDGRTASASGVVCYGWQVPAGYSNTSSGADCDDADPAVWERIIAWRDLDADGVGEGAFVEFCTSGAVPAGHATVGGDCAGGDPAHWRLASYAGVDRDGDGYTAREAGEVCTGAALADPYRQSLAGNDCEDADPARYRWVVLYRDLDGDGVGAGPRSVPCLGADLPPGWSVLGFDPDDASTARRDADADAELAPEL